MLPLSLAAFFILAVIIFLFSKQVIDKAHLFFYRITKSKNTSLNLLSFFLLPGIVVHELAHMLVAELLFVRTGKFCFKPTLDENQSVRVGSVQIAKTDPFRRTIIGLAPLVVGLAIIGLTFNFYLLPIFSSFSPPGSPFGHLGGVMAPGSTPTNFSIFDILLFLVTCHFSLVTSLTMFSSRQDLKQALVPAIILFILVAGFWLTGFRLIIPQYVLDFIDKVLIGLDKSLAFVIILNLAMFGILKGLNFAVSRLLRR